MEYPGERLQSCQIRVAYNRVNKLKSPEASESLQEERAYVSPIAAMSITIIYLKSFDAGCGFGADSFFEKVKLEVKVYVAAHTEAILTVQDHEAFVIDFLGAEEKL